MCPVRGQVSTPLWTWALTRVGGGGYTSPGFSWCVVLPPRTRPAAALPALAPSRWQLPANSSILSLPRSWSRPSSRLRPRRQGLLGGTGYLEYRRRAAAAAAVPALKPDGGVKSLSELVDMELQGLDSSRA